MHLCMLVCSTRDIVAQTYGQHELRKYSKGLEKFHISIASEIFERF